jgi:hypothetical protein
LKEFYELVEDVRDTLAERFMPSYSLENVYKITMYALIYATLQGKTDKYELLNSLERKIPPPLLAAAKRELVDKMHVLVKHIDAMLSRNRPILTHGEADLKYTIETVKREVGSVDYILVYDCMSLIEQVVISAFLKTRGIRSLFLNVVFLNPIGLTRFMTIQLHDTKYRPSLLGVARYVANQLNASLYMKNSLIDIKVHGIGLLGVDEFIERIAINRIAGEVLNASIKGKILVFSDHGYDIVLSRQKKYLYIVHGFKQGSSLGDAPLLLLSRISLFMGAYRVG